MIGVVLAVAVLAGVLYVALRHATPQGVAVSVWSYVIRMDPSDLFQRNLPRPGEDVCDAHPPQTVFAQLAETQPTYEAITRCHLEPGHGGRGHISLVALPDELVSPRPLLMQWSWLEPPQYRRLHRPRRWTWWRRLVVRLAAP